MDRLQPLRQALESRKGDIRQIATATGLSYDTVLRIKNGECDPGFSKVAVLADHLGVSLLCRADEADAA